MPRRLAPFERFAPQILAAKHAGIVSPVSDALKQRDAVIPARDCIAIDDAGAGAHGHSMHISVSGARPRSLTVLRHRVTISAWTPLYVSWCCLRCSPRSFAVWRLSAPSRLRQQCSLRAHQRLCGNCCRALARLMDLKGSLASRSARVAAGRA